MTRALVRFALLAACPTLAAAPSQGDEPKAPRAVLEARGYVVPARPATVAPRTAGQVTQLLFEEGQKVKQGDILARLDETLAKVDLQRAEAKLEVARARRSLVIKGARPEEIAVAEADCKVAEAELHRAAYVLEGMTVRAPFDGTVLSRQVDIGSSINPTAPGAASYLCKLANLREMEVAVEVPEGDLGKIQRLQPCLVRADAFPNTTYKGAVVRVFPVADRAKATVAVRIRIDVPEKDDMLRPEMAAHVVFLAKE
jgi:RND family efflux transporter MFP subunit